jgi:hypothetical protein
MRSDDAALFFGCRDRRTARRYLQELGVPFLRIGRRWYVRRVDLDRAVAAALETTSSRSLRSVRRQAVVPQARRLWD